MINRSLAKWFMIKIQETASAHKPVSGRGQHGLAFVYTQASLSGNVTG